MLRRSLQASLCILAHFCFIQPAISQRSFLPAKLSQLEKCSRVNCNGDDCFIVEVRNKDVNDNTIQQDEWQKMSQAMQQLASDDRLDDQFPAMMAVFPPRANQRQRYCSVKHEPYIDSNRVPMIIMHAKCVDNNCINKTCVCKEVEQYRQVYRRTDCKYSGPTNNITINEFVGGVFEKAFEKVSINCAAFRPT